MKLICKIFGCTEDLTEQCLNNIMESALNAEDLDVKRRCKRCKNKL